MYEPPLAENIEADGAEMPVAHAQHRGPLTFAVMGSTSYRLYFEVYRKLTHESTYNGAVETTASTRAP